MRVVKEFKVKNCTNCPYLKGSHDGMHCTHPKIKGWRGYEILDYQKLSKNCPLREDSVTEVRLVTALFEQ